MIHPWEILSSRYLLEAPPFLRVRQDACRLPDGRILPDYHVVEEPDVVMVFGITPAQEVLLVEQYKHAIGTVCLELPAGMSESDDHAAEAQREFREETGCTAAHWQHLATFINNPTRLNSRLFVYLAQGATPAGAQQFDAYEAIQVQRVPLAALPALIHSGRISVAGSVAAIWCALEHLRQPGPG
ncbi:MAG: NUDIX hydrolase [Anaerolineae bacterium]|jgi:8-oxo-dGTP pyrophosphatase MutT (NUDIX family)|nr:NUDIX hydrolase [Anaerolineae bacterium]